MEMISQKGNVLFLILVAVALFAALSYAVLTSSRGGGGNVNEETNLTKAAGISARSVGIQTAIIRMIANGMEIDELIFEIPEEFENDNGGTVLSCNQDPAPCVFHPEGGGAVWQNDIIINHFLEVPDIGSSVPNSSDGNDLVLQIHGIPEHVCEKINEEAGIGASVPTVTVCHAQVVYCGDTYLNNYHVRFMEALGESPWEDRESVLPDTFKGHSEGCFYADTENEGPGNEWLYTYYRVMVER